jgi:hypothetical protein
LLGCCTLQIHAKRTAGRDVATLLALVVVCHRARSKTSGKGSFLTFAAPQDVPKLDRFFHRR